MEIRKSGLEDVKEIMGIFDIARDYMITHGNATQWESGYPKEEILRCDIINGDNYVIVDNGIIVGTFSFIIGDEPTYQIIKNGEWHYNTLYGTIHRLASNGIAKGIARACFEYCLNLIEYIRIDTHKDNLPMQSAIEKFGFQACGNIDVRNGSERIAYDYLRQE